MSDHEKTHATHGFDDHHHIRATPAPVDRSHRAPRAVKDAVWDMVQGRVTPQQVADAEHAGQQVVDVPQDYVGAVAFHAVRELKRHGCGSAFSVKRHPDHPTVEIRWDRPGAELIPAEVAMARAYAQTTDCLTAYVRERDPGQVGTEAARAFLAALEQAEGKR